MPHDHLTFDWSTLDSGVPKRQLEAETEDPKIKKLQRLIRLQARRSDDMGLRRNQVDGYGYQFRYLVVKQGRAVFQCDDAMDAISYAVEHRPGCNITDLRSVDDTTRRKLIGQYLAPRENTRQQTPVLDRSTGKFTFGVHESLLKDRKKVVTIPPAKNTTPAEVIVRRFLNNQPLTPSYICPKCGYGDCMCEVKRHDPLPPSPSGVPTSGSRRKKTHELNFKTGDVFSATGILNDKLAGHKVPYSILWIQESL